MKKNKVLLVLGLLLGTTLFGSIAYSVKYKGAGSKLVFVSGTEYQQGTAGQIIVKVQNIFGRPINATWCNVSIYYPDKTLFVNNQPMTYGGAPGSWYYAFTTPFTQIGVYEAYVQCLVPLPGGARILGASKAFHVSQALTLLNESASAQLVIIS